MRKVFAFKLVILSALLLCGLFCLSSPAAKAAPAQSLGEIIGIDAGSGVLSLESQDVDEIITEEDEILYGIDCVWRINPATGRLECV